MVVQYIDVGERLLPSEKDLIRHVLGNNLKDLIPLEYYTLILSNSSKLYCLESKSLDLVLVLVLEEEHFVSLVLNSYKGISSINNIHRDSVAYGMHISKNPRSIWLDYIMGVGNKVINIDLFEKANYFIARYSLELKALSVVGGFEGRNEDSLESGYVLREVCEEWGMYQRNSRYALLNVGVEDCYIISRDGSEEVIKGVKEVFLGRYNGGPVMRVVSLRFK